MYPSYISLEVTDLIKNLLNKIPSQRPTLAEIK